MPFCQVCHFLCTPKSQMKQHMLVLNKILLNKHVLQTYSKWEMPWQSLLYLCTAVKFVQADLLSSHSQSEDYLITTRILVLWHKPITFKKQCCV